MHAFAADIYLSCALPKVLPALVMVVILDSKIARIGAGWISTTESQVSATPLPTPSEDPRLQEGLRQILQLDERLMQKSAEAAMVARETFPDAWLAADKKQAEKDQKLLLASLDRYRNHERARQAPANKLANIFR